MPFDHLAAYNLNIPQINYQPRAITPRPNLWAAALAGAAPIIGQAIAEFSPEGKQQRDLSDLELKFNTQKLNYLSSHPEIAFGGKTYIDPLHQRLIESQINSNNALSNQREGATSGGVDLNSYFPGETPPEVKTQTISGLPTDIPETTIPEPTLPPVEPIPAVEKPTTSSMPAIEVPDSAKIADINAPSSGVYSTDTYAQPSEEVAPAAPADSGGGIQLSDIKHYPPPRPGRVVSTDAQGRLIHDNGLIADPKTRSLEWGDGHGNVFRYSGGQGVEIIKTPTTNNKAEMEKAAARNGFLPTDPKYNGDYQAFVDDWKSFHPGGVDSQDIADNVKAGLTPPLPQYWGGRSVAGKVAATLAKDKFNIANAAMEYQQAQKLIAAGASPQVIRTRAGAESANLALDLADKLAGEWKAGQFAPLNRVQLALAESGGLHIADPEKAKQAADLAHRLLAQVGEATAQMGSVMQGSPSVTGEVLKVAQTQLSGNWDEQSFHNAVKQAKENMSYRLAGYNAALGTAPGSMYSIPNINATAAPAAAPPTPTKIAPDRIQQARDWVAAHPDDPKAAEVQSWLQKLQQP